MLCVGNASGQSTKLILYPDSAKGKFIPSAIHAGVDLIGAGKTIIRDDVDWLNFYVGVDMYKYTFNVEYGIENRIVENTSSRYEASGNYFRIGPDVNFLFRDPDFSALFFGLRYGRTTFSDQLNYQVTDPVWGGYEGFLENEKLASGWGEVVAGMRVKLFQLAWFGFTGRFKFGVKSFTDERLIPNYVPGYGRADLQTTWEFNYWLIFRLPLKKPAMAIIER
jgi:hypothetical protein